MRKKDPFPLQLGLTLTGILIISYAASWLAQESWICDLFRHFINQYIVGGLVLTLWFIFLRKPKLAVLPLLVAVAGLCEIVIASDIIPSGTAGAAKTQQTITIAQYNRRYALEHHAKFAKWLRQTKPDILVIQEARQTHADAMDRLKDLYPHQLQEERQNAFGMILASRYPLKQAQAIETIRHTIDNFYIHALIDLPGDTSLSLYAVHPPPPTGAEAFKQRNADIKTVTRVVQSDGAENIVMLGDWNMTPYSPYFKDILQKTSLKNQHNHVLPVLTWPSLFLIRPLQITIDHILHKGPALQLISKKRGPTMGSDHYPVLATYALTPNAPDNALDGKQAL